MKYLAYFGLPAIILGALVYIFWPDLKALAATAPQPGSGGAGGTTGGTGSGSGGSSSGGSTGGGAVALGTLNLNAVLKNGSRGNEVKKLQAWLNMLEVANPLVVDGIFGPKTEAKLQRVRGITSTTLNGMLVSAPWLPK